MIEHKMFMYGVYNWLFISEYTKLDLNLFF